MMLMPAAGAAGVVAAMGVGTGGSGVGVFFLASASRLSVSGPASVLR
jgi:hypothetical protein